MSLIDGLTKREREVLAWLHQGLSNKEIALAMGISHRTVQKHLQRIYKYFCLQSRAELVGLKSMEERAQGSGVCQPEN